MLLLMITPMLICFTLRHDYAPPLPPYAMLLMPRDAVMLYAATLRTLLMLLR